jgi:hypothetical protein
MRNIDQISMIGIVSLWSGSGQIFLTMFEQECRALNAWASLNAAIENVKNI